ncbi:MAG TPA: Stf0 family sulfotransferase [Rhizomicrobium sp.]|nr:Stf0 family sulfotransferase [Rhizomicrobium sp.]
MTLSYSIVDLDSARHDAPGGVPLRRVVLCSSPRTGSYLLCEAMRRLGLGVPHEYFNPPTMRVLTRRWALAMPERVKPSAWLRLGHARNLRALEAYLAALMRMRTRNFVFAAKLQYWQYERLLDNPTGAVFLNNARFLYLYREDLLGQAISFRLAEATGKWGVDGVATTTAKRARDLLDIEALDRAVAMIRGEEKGWRRFFARESIRPRILSYESMRDDPLAAARSLAGDLLPADAEPGLPPATTPDVEGAEARDLKRRMREAYLAARPLPERDSAQHGA